MIKIKSLKIHNFKQLKEIRLKIPDRGSVLVEGRNEAGKSTLFEAVYFGLFGDALVTEENRNNLADLIEYSASMAVVELGIEVRDRLLVVTRTIHREKPNAWRLSIFGPDGEEEQVSKNAAVDERIIREIGLDGDALLNSCFVEQKKLDKLEGLSAADRRRSLLSILNLEALERLQVQFKRRREDDFRLGELRDKFELSQVLETIPAREIEKAEIERELALVEMKKALTALEERHAQIARARELIENLTPERGELALRIEKIGRLKEARAAAEKIAVNLQRIAEWEREISEIDEKLKGLAITEEQLPGKVSRLKGLAILARQLARLKRIGDVAAECERELANLRGQFEAIAKLHADGEQLAGRIGPVLQQIESGRGEQTRMAALVRTADQRDALQGWRRAKVASDGLAQVHAEEARIREEQEDLGRRESAQKRELSAANRQVILSVAITLALLVTTVAGWLGGHPTTMGLGAVAAAAMALLVVSGFGRARRLRRRVAQIGAERQLSRESLLRLEGQRQTLSAAGQGEVDRLEYYEELLRGMEMAAPESDGRFEALLAELESKLEGQDAAALREKLSALQQGLAGQEAAVKELEAQQSRIQQELRARDETALHEREDLLKGRQAKAREIAARRQPHIEARAAELDVAAELQAVRDAGLLLRGEIKRDREEIGGHGALIERQEARRKSVEELHASNEKLYPAILVADGPAPEWSRDQGLDRYQEFGRFFATLVADLDEQGASSALAELDRQVNGAKGEIVVHQREIEQQKRRLAELSRAMGVLLPDGEIARRAMEERIPALKSAPEHDSGLRERRDQMTAELGHLTRRRQELVAKLRLEGVELNSSACEMELRQFERELKVRRKAEEIVERARESLVAKVLPSTIEHMRRILPALTMDRYHDADITEDYKIKVWDERAGGWKQKNIFSGGTKDQFSLALRLAFALATLPQERGAAPGFIFLDEPLSSFDQERSLALMDLLTTGEIAETFDQIFVISHSQVLNPTMFHHHLVLEDGRIAATTLDVVGEESA